MPPGWAKAVNKIIILLEVHYNADDFVEGTVFSKLPN